MLSLGFLALGCLSQSKKRAASAGPVEISQSRCVVFPSRDFVELHVLLVWE